MASPGPPGDIVVPAMDEACKFGVKTFPATVKGRGDGCCPAKGAFVLPGLDLESLVKPGKLVPVNSGPSGDIESPAVEKSNGLAINSGVPIGRACPELDGTILTFFVAMRSFDWLRETGVSLMTMPDASAGNGLLSSVTIPKFPDTTSLFAPLGATAGFPRSTLWPAVTALGAIGCGSWVATLDPVRGADLPSDRVGEDPVES